MIDPETLIARMSDPTYYPSIREGLDELFDNVEDAIDEDKWSYLTKLVELARLAEHLNSNYGVSIVRSVYRVKERFAKSWALLVLHLQEYRPEVRRPTYDQLVKQATAILEAG